VAKSAAHETMQNSISIQIEHSGVNAAIELELCRIVSEEAISTFFQR
jgi:hypothetical protein